MNFATTNYNEFYKDLKEALKGVEDKYGIDFDVKGKFTYESDNSECRFKMVAVNRKSDGSSNVEDSARNQRLENWKNAFYRNAWKFDLEGQFGAEVTLKGTKYKIIGLRPKAKTNNVVVEVVSSPDKIVYAPTAWVQDALNVSRTPVDGM
jgi:hypothetical protein